MNNTFLLYKISDTIDKSFLDPFLFPLPSFHTSMGLFFFFFLIILSLLKDCRMPSQTRASLEVFDELTLKSSSVLCYTAEIRQHCKSTIFQRKQFKWTV